MSKHLLFPRGAVIFLEEYPADVAYIIADGEVEIYRTDDDGTEHRLAVLKAGEMFGELGLLEDKPRSASARAHTDVVLMTMDL